MTRQFLAVLLLAATLALAGGCTASQKKGASFVFGPTQSDGDWLSHDCWNQLDAGKPGSGPREAP